MGYLICLCTLHYNKSDRAEAMWILEASPRSVLIEKFNKGILTSSNEMKVYWSGIIHWQWMESQFVLNCKDGFHKITHANSLSFSYVFKGCRTKRHLCCKLWTERLQHPVITPKSSLRSPFSSYTLLSQLNTPVRSTMKFCMQTFGENNVHAKCHYKGLSCETNL